MAEGKITINPYKPYVLGEAIIEEMRKAGPDTSRKIWHQEFAELLATKVWHDPRTGISDPRYWVPLIARLSGLRSEEILQLKPGNLRRDGEVLYFDIEQGTGQSVKSVNGRRMVPVHSQLVELGIEELFAQQRKLGRRRIFDTVPRAKSGKKNYTATFTKRFNYYRRSVCLLYTSPSPRD